MSNLTVGSVSFGTRAPHSFTTPTQRYEALCSAVTNKLETKITAYTAGFLFNSTLSYVALIEKQRPAYLKGKLNAIGGHIEPGETPLQCQVREFREETGMTVNDWTQYAILRIPGSAEIHFFYAFTNDFFSLEQKTDERLAVHYLPDLHAQNYAGCVPNLKYLLPMALLHFKSFYTSIYEITEPA